MHLDLSAITTVYEDEERGYPPYHPVMMTKVLVYALLRRRLLVAPDPAPVGSKTSRSACWPRATSRTFARSPTFGRRTWRRCRASSSKCCSWRANWARRGVGRVALDGTQGQGERVEAQGDELRTDGREATAAAGGGEASCSRRRRRPTRPRTREYGADRRGDELPAELQRRESRLARIREAKRVLEARAKDEAAAAGQPADSAKPDPKAQYNFTDPESRIMKGPDGFVQAYNAQIAVDDLQLIVGQAVTQETNDKQQLVPMIATIDAAIGRHAHAAPRRRGLLLGRELGRDRRHAHRRLHLDAEADTWRATRARVRAARCRRRRRASIGCRASCTRKAGAAVYAARKAIVEPVFGQIKQARGFRQFLLRGLEKVQGEWSLVCTTHNILKMYRLYG